MTGIAGAGGIEWVSRAVFKISLYSSVLRQLCLELQKFEATIPFTLVVTLVNSSSDSSGLLVQTVLASLTGVACSLGGVPQTFNLFEEGTSVRPSMVAPSCQWYR